MLLSTRTAETLAKLSPSEVRELLLDLGAPAVLKSFDRDCQRRYAALLLGQGCTRTITRDRLMQRYQISKSSAYRLIDAVIQSCSRTGHVLGNTGRIFNSHNQ